MQGREGVRWDRGPNGPATESLWLRHGRRLASAALGITASSIWRTQLIKNEEKTEKEKKKPARLVAATAVAVAVAAAAATAAAAQTPTSPSAAQGSPRLRPCQAPPLTGPAPSRSARPSPCPAPLSASCPLASPATSGWWGSGKKNAPLGGRPRR